MIYAVEIQDGKFVKIGFADTVSARIAQLQTGNPYEIRTIFSVDGTLRQEQTLHAALRVAFARVRVPMPPNEWYPGKTPFFQKFLSELKFGFEFGFTYLESYNPALRQPGVRKAGNWSEPNLLWVPGAAA